MADSPTDMTESEIARGVEERKCPKCGSTDIAHDHGGWSSPETDYCCDCGEPIDEAAPAKRRADIQGGCGK